MDFAKYHEKLRTIPNIDVSALYSTDYAALLFTLYALGTTYALKQFGDVNKAQSPVDIQFKRTKTKSSMRCTFKSLDIGNINNSIIDLALDKTVSLAVSDDSKTVLVIDYIHQPVEIGIRELE